MDFIEVNTTLIFYEDEVKVLPVSFPLQEEKIMMRSLPRRKHPLKLRKSQLIVKQLPQWISCAPAKTGDGIWSMAITEREAVYAAVLATSIKVLNQVLDYLVTELF